MHNDVVALVELILLNQC